MKGSGLTCQVQRLMRAHAIQGAKRRGKPWRTTKAALLGGVVYFAFVIDAFSRREDAGDRRAIGLRLRFTARAPRELGFPLPTGRNHPPIWPD